MEGEKEGRRERWKKGEKMGGRKKRENNEILSLYETL